MASSPQPQCKRRQRLASLTVREIPRSSGASTIPSGIPGATAPPLILPPVDEAHPQKRLTAIDILFPNPPPVYEIATPADTQVVTLEQLEELAVNNNPTLVQARGNITVNRGSAIQAGVYPNPVIGYETDSFGSSNNRNYEGMSLQQTVKTAGKLTLQRTIANMDMMNAELQWRRTELDVRRQVRAGYYNVLVAQEANKINAALYASPMKFTSSRSND